VAVKAEASKLNGPFEGVRADFASRRYRHDEIVAGEVGTRFANDTDELNLFARHRPAGRLSGTIGGWIMSRRFAASGDEALAPPIDEKGIAAFVYEEVTWPHVTFQFGARVNHASYEPDGGLPPRDFTDVSGSVGLLFRPAQADDRLTIAVSLARAARNPALEELYFFGPHPGNFAFEVGNPNLDSEHGLGLDVSMRWRAPRATGEVTYFRNSIDDYVLRSPISDADFDARFGHEAHADGEDHGHGEDLPAIEFLAADSVLDGFESHADINLAGGLGLELGLDYVRGSLRATDEPLPRIPPLRFRGGLHYERNAFEAGGEVLVAAKQERIFAGETATDGYRLLKFFASWSFGTPQVTNTITARLDNAANELYRNHLSLIKDFVPEMGRNFKLLYSVKF
jgi:iron complex outermembrane receptor protein